MSKDDTVYRVMLDTNAGTAEVLCIGMDNLDGLADGTYCIGELPRWVTDRIAVLSVLPVPPPINIVPEVGRRMSANVYWVYPQNSTSD